MNIFSKWKHSDKDLSDIKAKFERVCTNAYSVDKVYKKKEYIDWAKQVKEKGQLYFYTEPVDPKKPMGERRLCEPKYVYRLKEDLTVEEFRRLFGE